MIMTKEVFPKWGEYYTAIVSHKESNPKHKVILQINNASEDNIVFTVVNTNYEERKFYHSSKLNYFELVEKIDMDYKGEW